MIAGLRDRFRCIAPDYPGFGRSRAPEGYGYTPVEHAAVIERLVVERDLRDITMMVQDWGGPIGFAVAGRHPERFSRFVVGNTWAWPKTDPSTWAFSKFLGGPVGKQLILHRNFFVERVMPAGVRRSEVLTDEVMDEYRRPFPTAQSRVPTWVLPREITASQAFLRGVERGLERIADRPALIVWPDGDVAFRERERRRWEQVFADHRTVELQGVGHYIQEEAPEEIVEAIRAWAT